MDLNKVLAGGPWAFEQNALVYKRMIETEDPQEIQLNDMDIWVQVYDIPRGFISEKVLENMGNFIGKFVKTDPTNFNGGWKQFVRIRVRMNVLKPLK